MITETEITWIKDHYPKLSVSTDRTEVNGELEFIAAYDRAKDSFTPCLSSDQVADGLVLKGAYKISVKKGGGEKSLPILKVEMPSGKLILDRHFYHPSKNACVCGQMEEFLFMESGFSIPLYLERMVIPFLYGQSFYDLHGKWPWDEYAHGPAGIFQSYYRNGQTVEHAKACMERLKLDKKTWPRIEAVLLGNEKLTRQSGCFCLIPDNKLRKCHPDARLGILKLQETLKLASII